MVHLPGAPGLAPCHYKGRGAPHEGVGSGPQLSKHVHPDPGTHLRDEATARHRVEAELGHMLGLSILGPPAYQQEEMWSFLLNARPRQRVRTGLAALLECV